MNIIITGRKMQITPPLRKYTEDKIGKFEKFLPADAEANVTMGVQKHLQRVEVFIKAKGMHIQAESVTEEMYSAIDEVTEKLDRQIKKLKGKLSSHRAKPAERKTATRAAEAPAEFAEGLVIERKRFAAKPMSAEEAALQLTMSDANFFVFTDSDSGAISVIYRKNNGEFALIEPVAR